MRRICMVVGVPHSSTTLLATMIGSHSATYLIPRETGWFVPRRNRDAFAEFVQLDETLEPHTVMIVEKTPEHIRHITEARAVLPDVRFAMTLRDPRDIVASQFVRWGDLDHSLRTTRHMLRIANKHLGDHDVHVVRYERLIEDPAGTLASLDGFLGLDFEQSQLAFHTHAPNWFGLDDPKSTSGQGTEHREYRAWQVKQPLMDRRGRWREILTQDQIDRVVEYLANDAQESGYSDFT